jgi:ATP-dependent phosphofructokinase / diphosphate-dependent phosphofructokinase
VINASLAGVVAEARAAGYTRVLGLRYGILGALRGEFVDLTEFEDSTLDRLKHTPSSALGSCRYKLRPGDAVHVAETLKAQDAQAFIYIGGNDSADTSLKIQGVAEGVNVVGVPKTIDNDLAGTDHCPGYGSAARFVAQVTRETAEDTRAMRATDPIRLIEVMGRHAGWLPGAAWLARQHDGDAPHLVYVPERPRSVEEIVFDVNSVYRSEGWCVVVLCENQPTPEGQVLGAVGEPRWVDAFGHAYFESPAQWLAQRMQSELQVRVRFDKPGTIQRMAIAYVSSTDRAEAELVGRQAVRLAASGESGVMVSLERGAGSKYTIATGTAPLETVANEQRRLPAAFVNEDGNGLTQAFVDYATPLIGEPLPEMVRLL